MVLVTKLNNSPYYLNPHLIETIESRPDTTITLASSKNLVIKENPKELIKKIIEYRRSIGIEINGNEGKGISE